MAIDKSKIKEFRKGMNEVLKGLSFDEHYAVVSSKLFDFIAKNPAADLPDIKAAVRKVFGPEFNTYVGRVFSEYDNVVYLANSVYEDLGFDLTRDIKKIRAIEKINSIRYGAYDRDMQKGIVKTIRDGIAKELRSDEITQNLIDLGGKVTSYADTITNTQLSAYAQTCKVEKANMGEVFYYQYVGLIYENSRAFCIGMVGNTMHISDINNITEAEVGSPFIDPCIIYKGGWNCVHEWEPDPFYEGEEQTESSEGVVPAETTRKAVEEFIPANTVREAREWAETEYTKGAAEYPMDSFRFKHLKGAERGKFDYKTLSVDSANDLNKLLDESFGLSDKMNIPRLSGVNSNTGRNAATIGDGILGWNKQTEFFPVHETIPEKPRLSHNFFGADLTKKKQSTFWHEYGHHIHQQLGVEKVRDYLSPPIEETMKLLFRIKNGRKVSATIYGGTNHVEFFAEHYSLHKMGRDDLVPNWFLDFLKEKGIL